MSTATDLGGLPAPEPIKRLTDRRRLILLMMASGVSNVDIARAFELTEDYVSSLRRSTLFREEMAQIHAELRQQTVDDVLELITREAKASVEMLVEVRDDKKLKASAPGRNVQRQAANDLLDRHPRFAKRQPADSETVIRIQFGEADMARMQRAVIDVTPREGER